MQYDLEGTLYGKNKTTGDTLEITFTPKGWKTERSLFGKVSDKDGNIIYTIKGLWLDELFLIDSQGNEE